MRAIKILTIVLGVFNFSPLHSQDYFWASEAGGLGNDGSELIVMDKEGNTYSSGYFSSFSCQFQTATLSCHGYNDNFIVKYDPSGNELWVRQLGMYENYEESIETISGMVFDSLDQTLLVTGTFYQYMILPDTVIQGQHLDVFVMKLDLDGHVIWVRTGGGEYHDFSMGIAYDDQQNVYISGSNAHAATFGNTIIPQGGFIVKYDMNGNLLWALNKFRYYYYAPGPIYTEAPPLYLSFHNASLFVYGSIISNSIVIDTIALTEVWGGNASYLASFTPEGEIQWLTKVGGSPSQSTSNGQISADDSGNFYLTGSFKVIGIYGSDTLTTPGNTIYDFYLTKVAPGGSFIWAIQGNSTSFATGYSTVCDEEGNVYSFGYYNDSVQLGGQTLISHTQKDMFLVSYTSNGFFRGLYSYTNTGIQSIAFDPNGNMLLGGVFEDYLTLGSTTLLSNGLYDSFLAKCSPITSTKETPAGPDNTLLIYANPTTGRCNITIPEEFRHEVTLTLYIYDNQGKLIQQASLEQTAGEPYRLDIRAQAAGVYNAVLRNGTKSYTGRIVFEKRN